MTALSAALFLIKWKGALHAIDYDVGMAAAAQDRKKRCGCKVPLLAELCSELIASDAGFTKSVIPLIPPQIVCHLMRAALLKGHDRTIEVLLPSWPNATFSLHQLWPDLYNNLAILFDHNLHNERMRQGIQCTNGLILSFLQLVKSGLLTRLRCLDLRGFPTVDLMVYRLAEAVVSIQQEQVPQVAKNVADLPEGGILNKTNAAPGDSVFTVIIDCAVRDDDTFRALSAALAVAQNNTPKLRLIVSKLDVSCLGTSSIAILLDHLWSTPLSGLCLQYNSISNSGLLCLFQYFHKFNTLMALDLSCNNIVLPGNVDLCLHFSEALRSMAGLRRLDLSNNRLSDCVSSILSKCEQPFEYLKLSACVLHDQDLNFLCRAKFATSLAELDLSENGVIAHQLRSFAAVLAIMTSLQVIEIEDCKFDRHHLIEVVSAISQLKRLRYLNFARHSFSSQILGSDLLLLGSLPSLEYIRLSYTQECYYDAQDPETYDHRKAALREKVESQFAFYREQTVPNAEPVEFIWIEYHSFF